MTGGTSVTLPAGATIPAAGSCVVTVNATTSSAGTYLNRLSPGALVTSNGVNADPAIATLTAVLVAIPPIVVPVPPQQIPSLSVPAMFVIMLMVCGIGCVASSGARPGWRQRVLAVCSCRHGSRFAPGATRRIELTVQAG